MNNEEALKICKSMVKADGCGQGPFHTEERLAIEQLIYSVERNGAETVLNEIDGLDSTDYSDHYFRALVERHIIDRRKELGYVSERNGNSSRIPR